MSENLFNPNELTDVYYIQITSKTLWQWLWGKVRWKIHCLYPQVEQFYKGSKVVIQSLEIKAQENYNTHKVKLSIVTRKCFMKKLAYQKLYDFERTEKVTYCRERGGPGPTKNRRRIQ